MNLKRQYCKYREKIRCKILRLRLTNTTPTLICSNCTGGFIYHWLGLQFRSPFINLCMCNEDFIFAMENFDKFISWPLAEDISANHGYPCGIGYGGVLVHFIHYKSWDDAIQKWESRKSRINRDNMAIMLCDMQDENGDGCQLKLIERFEKLPFKNKIIFSDNEYPGYSSVVYLPSWTRDIEGIYQTVHRIFGKRPIDDFDFVGYINKLNS